MFGKRSYEDYELHQMDREELHEEWVWVRKESLKDIEGRRPALLFEFKDNRKRVCCETLYADDTYLANRRNPILVGKIFGFCSKDNFKVLSHGGKRKTSIVVTDDTKFRNGMTEHSLKENVPVCVHYSRTMDDNSDGTDEEKYEITANCITPGNELVFMNAWYRRRQLGIENRVRQRIPLSITEPSWTGQAMWWQLRACARHPQIAVLMSTVLAVVGTGLGIVGLAAVIKDLSGWNDITVFRCFWLSIGAVGFFIFVMGFRPLYLRAKLSRSDAK
jgi:hypothetical protein